MTLNISRQAISYAGPDDAICETSTYTITGSSAQYYATLKWTTTGTGTFDNSSLRMELILQVLLILFRDLYSLY